jgi:hypothetical protein
VIAFGRGGVTETVVDGQTGVLFGEQSVGSILAAVERFESLSFEPARIRRHAERFSAACFRSAVTDEVRREWSAFKLARVQRSQVRRSGMHPAGYTTDLPDILATGFDPASAPPLLLNGVNR